MLPKGERLKSVIWVVLALVVIQATLYVLFFQSESATTTRCLRTETDPEREVQHWLRSHRLPNYTCTVESETVRTRENFMSNQEIQEAKGLRVLVTGGAGFIASHVAKYCASELGMDVIVVDNLSGGFLRNLPFQGEGPNGGSITFVKGDIRDTCFMEFLFTTYGPFEYVYHLAAYAAEGLSSFIRRFNYHNNMVASSDLLSKSVKHNVKCFIFTSSIAVYGPNQLPMTEDTVPQPEDPYGISKYAMELDLKAARVNFGMDYIIFRPHNVYGPGQNIADKYRNVIGIFINQILRNEPITIFGDGLQTRAFSFIEDVAPVIAVSPFVRAARNQVFNVGADQPYTLLELASSVKEAMGVPDHEVKHLDARHEVKDAYSDHAKTRCFFKTPPATDLKTGLREMVAWVKALKEDYTPVEFDEDVEVTKNMPPSWLANMKPPSPYKVSMKLDTEFQTRVNKGLQSLATKGYNDQVFTCLQPKPPLRQRERLEVQHGKKKSKILLALTSCNIWTKTELSLHSISKLQDDFDLIVVDDRSSDGTTDYLKALKVPFIQPEEIRGLTYSWNLAYRYAREKGYSYLIISNNDVLIPNGVIDKMHYLLNQYIVVAPMSTDNGAGHVRAQGLEKTYHLTNPDTVAFVNNPLNFQKVQQILDEASDSVIHAQSTSEFNGFFFGVDLKRIEKAEFSTGVLFDPKNKNVGNELDLYNRMKKVGMKDEVGRSLSTFVFHYKSSTIFAHLGCKKGETGKPCEDVTGDWRENLDAFHPKTD